MSYFATKKCTIIETSLFVFIADLPLLLLARPALFSVVHVFFVSMCTHSSCVYVCVCVVQLQQTCACCPWRRGHVVDTRCAGTSTAKFRPADPSSTVAAKETATASVSWRSVRRPASGRPKVLKHTHKHTLSLTSLYQVLNLWRLTTGLLCRFSSLEDNAMIVAKSFSATGLLVFTLLL